MSRDTMRLVTFSDGVFAITITLLILEIKPPTDDKNLLHGLVALWPSYLELPGRDQVMLDLLYDYQNNVKLYPRWHEYMRAHQPPALLPWGQNDRFFPPEGARAYPQDLPEAELHLLDTGHFATATHHDEIAKLIAGFIEMHVAEEQYA